MKKNSLRWVLLALAVLMVSCFALMGCSEPIPDDSGMENQEIESADAYVDEDSSSAVDESVAASADYEYYYFRTQNQKDQHYDKHGKEMGFANADDYEAAACDVVNNPNALHKTEAEDGDDVYYVEDTNEFVVVSTDGYIRTYFWPDAGKKYYDKQ